MTSRFLDNGAPTRCASCCEPFEGSEGRLEAWRFGARYFCHQCAERHRRPGQQRLWTVQRAAAIASLAVRTSMPGHSRLGSEPLIVDSPLPARKLPG
jgi:hypothetical protein